MNNCISSETLPKHIVCGPWKTSHVQGIAIDTARRYMYFSFTTLLVKTDLAGNVIGTAGGFDGHLGDLAFNDADGKLYGSLEYKARSEFYIAVFDVDKIVRPGMDAFGDGVMSVVYLPEVVADYSADADGNGRFDGDTADTGDHRYGCSGIDGVSFGPKFGQGLGTNIVFMVAYGIYGNTNRGDNDYQVILQYDWRRFCEWAKPELGIHRGPAVAKKHFLYTGNTTYGIQNLEYDPYTGNWYVAVYTGHKDNYPNYPMFVIDGRLPPHIERLKGQPGYETGIMLSLAGGRLDKASGVAGYDFPDGNTGLIALGDGYYYIAQATKTDEGSGADVRLYRRDAEKLFVLA